MFPYHLDHIAIAVSDLDDAIRVHTAQYGLEPLYREVVAEQGVEEAMIPVGGSYVQLLQPLRPESPVGRFLERRGPGLHHIAYAVTDIEAALVHLAAQGVQLIDSVPRRGGRGAQIAFVHPAAFSGTLIELVQHPE